VPTHACGYGKIQTDKLCLIPPEMLYSPQISTVHSLEFLGEGGEPTKLGAALTHGSLGNSPSATAYYLLLANNSDSKALSYLNEVQDRSGHVIYLYPFATFELAWVLNHLSYSGLSITTFADQKILNDLDKEMKDTGVGLDPTFGIPDADTTSVTLYLLSSAGYEVDPAILLRFEDKDKGIFRTYSYERNPSVSTNTHALQALRVLHGYPNRLNIKEQIILMLLASRKFNIYWTDKWHASPYYATAHTLIELLKEGDFLASACGHTIDWILHTQNENGSWGFFGVGTAEETAYALMTLLHYYNRFQSIDPDIIKRGADFLSSSYQDNTDFPELWLGKDLYTPTDVVHSSILSTLILFERTF
jgi:halimadienyl-diphosphate synthase